MDAFLESALRAGTPYCWCNPHRQPVAAVRDTLGVSLADIEDAAQRLDRFAPLLASLFPELRSSGGRIESQLLPVPALAACLQEEGLPVRDSLFLKADHMLPLAGSVKARGGFHTVLVAAEHIAMAEGLLADTHGDYRRLGAAHARAIFARHTLSVGSTGNLGLSIGVLGRAFGFAVTVHMSSEAKAWKKDALRALGASVIEHAGDYTTACAVAREQAAQSPTIHFIDDENSLDLFLGYAVAGLRLPAQLATWGIFVSSSHPLCLHLPCGVGGAPGGIALGTRLTLGDDALAFFIEPTAAPCMLLGLASGRHADMAVSDIGLSGRTLADGLAVGRPSRFVGKLMEPVVDGICTVDDATMLRYLAMAWEESGLRLEPSAAAALAGPVMVRNAGVSRLAGHSVTHIVWATGGDMMPDEDFFALVAAGKGERPGP